MNQAARPEKMPEQAAEKALADAKSRAEAETALRAALDAHAEAIDYSTQLGLARARRTALLATEPRRQSRRAWLPLTAAIPAAVVLFLLLRAPSPTPVPAAGGDMPIAEIPVIWDDLELLSEHDEPETLADLEFYQWMAAQPKG